MRRTEGSLRSTRECIIESRLELTSVAREKVLQFLRTPVTGAGPEDYGEYNFEDRGL